MCFWPVSVQLPIRDGDVAQLVGHWIDTLPTQVRFHSAARDFFPGVNCQGRLSYYVRTPPCAIPCIYICAHFKDLVVHVRVRWIMETLKHPACTVGWVARLCRSWLSRGKATRISHGRNPIETIQLWKVTRKRVKIVFYIFSKPFWPVPFPLRHVANKLADKTRTKQRPGLSINSTQSERKHMSVYTNRRHNYSDAWICTFSGRKYAQNAKCL